MPHCYALIKDAEQKLLASVPDNIDRYRSDDPWFPQTTRPGQILIRTPVEIVGDIQFLESDGRTHYDFENAKTLFLALPNLSPVQASDERLWTWFTHFHCWSYMRSRWPIEKKNKSADTPERVIKERYFVTTRRGLTRNGISRLWWYCWLTHRPGNADPFMFTEVLLRKLDITQQLLERSFGKCHDVRISFLEFVLSHPKECLEGGKSRAIVRHLAKSLNFRGGFGLLDAVRKDAMHQFLASALASILSPGAIEESAADEDYDDE